jgi:GntR family transcriptional repressor for pyruvate dehydrogenase complex
LTWQTTLDGARGASPLCRHLSNGGQVIPWLEFSVQDLLPYGFDDLQVQGCPTGWHGPSGVWSFDYRGGYLKSRGAFSTRPTSHLTTSRKQCIIGIVVIPADQEANTSKFAAVERTFLAQEIAQRFLRLLQDGKLQAGERLPAERELASLLGVGRPSLREALRALQLMNVVEVRPGDGTYVSSLKAEHLAEPLRLLLRLQDVTYLEVLEARRSIEPAIAALAAERIGEDELGQLRSCLTKARECVDDPAGFLEADLELHSVIVEASRNPLLIGIMASISSLGPATRQRTAYIPGVRKVALEDHGRIVEAIALRDADAARKAIEDHISHIEEALRAASDEQAPSEGLPI